MNAGDWVDTADGKRGVLRFVNPVLEDCIIELPNDRIEAPLSTLQLVQRPTFDDLAAWAIAKGMRLERGTERTRGARSGFVLWTRRGTWVRCGSLKEVFERIEHYAR
jgi:hypothetical protein